MKNIWSKLVLVSLLATFMCSACSKDDAEEGTVSFVVTYSQSSKVDNAVLATVYNEFVSQFSKLDGVVIDKTFILKGKYATCNKAITNACTRAEDNMANLSPSIGYFDIIVTATYDKKDGNKVLYSKTFGTKE